MLWPLAVLPKFSFFTVACPFPVILDKNVVALHRMIVAINFPKRRDLIKSSPQLKMFARRRGGHGNKDSASSVLAANRTVAGDARVFTNRASFAKVSPLEMQSQRIGRPKEDRHTQNLDRS